MKHAWLRWACMGKGVGGGEGGGWEVQQSMLFVVSISRHDASVTVSQGCSRSRCKRA